MTLWEQASREFLVSPAHINNLNVHTSVGLSHVKCKILTYFCDVIHLFTLVCIWQGIPKDIYKT